MKRFALVLAQIDEETRTKVEWPEEGGFGLQVEFTALNDEDLRQQVRVALENIIAKCPNSETDITLAS